MGCLLALNLQEVILAAQLLHADVVLLPGVPALRLHFHPETASLVAQIIPTILKLILLLWNELRTLSRLAFLGVDFPVCVYVPGPTSS